MAGPRGFEPRISGSPLWKDIRRLARRISVLHSVFVLTRLRALLDGLRPQERGLSLLEELCAFHVCDIVEPCFNEVPSFL